MNTPRNLFAFCALGIIKALFAPSAEAHLPISTNIAIDIELNDKLLVVEPWLPTFLVPPLADLTLENQDEWPDPSSRFPAIEEYFDQTCPIEIDGVRVRPKMQKLRLQPMEQAKHLGEIIDFVEARIVLHYEAESPPEKMKLRWGIYPPVPDGGWGELVEADQNPQEFDMMMFVDRKEDFVFFSPEEPEFYWHRKPKEVSAINVIAPDELDTASAGAEPPPTARRVPVASIAAALAGVAFFVGAGFAKLKLPVRLGGLIAAGAIAIALRPATVTGDAAGSGITEAQAVEVFRELQANLYRAFDYETEDQVYDVLAQSVDGALLDDIYTEVYQSLLVVDKSAAVCKVHEVEVLDCVATAIDPSADGRSERFDIACHWRVHGLVQHFEHIHRRVNEYRADYRLTRKPEGWKITGVAVRQQDRLDPKTMQPSDDF